jgi:hypothetical protein
MEFEAVAALECGDRPNQDHAPGKPGQDLSSGLQPRRPPPGHRLRRYHAESVGPEDGSCDGHAVGPHEGRDVNGLQP